MHVCTDVLKLKISHCQSDGIEGDARNFTERQLLKDI